MKTEDPARGSRLRGQGGRHAGSTVAGSFPQGPARLRCPRDGAAPAPGDPVGGMLCRIVLFVGPPEPQSRVFPNLVLIGGNGREIRKEAVIDKVVATSLHERHRDRDARGLFTAGKGIQAGAEAGPAPTVTFRRRLRLSAIHVANPNRTMDRTSRDLALHGCHGGPDGPVRPQHRPAADGPGPTRAVHGAGRAATPGRRFPPQNSRRSWPGRIPPPAAAAGPAGGGGGRQAHVPRIEADTRPRQVPECARPRVPGCGHAA